MNVLIVHPSKGFYGGAEEVVVQLCKYLGSQGAEVIYLTNSLPREMRNDLVGWREIVEVGDHLSMWMETQKFMHWADIVNVHNFPATLATFSTKKPIVWMCNEPAELFTNWWRKPIEAFNRWWVRKSDMKVVVADRFNADRFKKIYGVEPKVIPYGIDYDFWSQGECEETDGFTILQVGTITPYKNQMASIKVLEQLRNEIPNLKLVLAGIGDVRYIEFLMQYVKERNLKVLFTGSLCRDGLRGWYNRSDVLLHPVKSQGGWLVPFEAICAGLPVVVSEEFTGADIIKENKLGIVTRDYANVIKHGIVGYQQPWDEITQTAGLWVKENLTWEKFGEDMVKVFEEVIK